MKVNARKTHKTGQPIVPTVNDPADQVVIEVKAHEKPLTAIRLAQLLVEAEKDIAAGRTRSARAFLKRFRRLRT